MSLASEYELDSTIREQFHSVTESPNQWASNEQIQMLHTRYYWASRMGEGKSVLEVACGTGIGLSAIVERADSVVAGDICEKNVEVARTHYPRDIEIIQLSGTKLPFASNGFDVVILFEAIYYFQEPALFFSEASRVLRKGGKLLISQVNPRWRNFHRSAMSFKYFCASEFISELERYGFTVTVHASFFEFEDGIKNKVISWLKRTASKLHLIPKSMHGKRFLKRLFQGRLTKLPRKLAIDLNNVKELRPFEESRSPITKILYIEATKVSEAKI